MNREKGVSSLALVLMLLVLGSLLLQGMSQQDRSFASRVSMESQSLRRQAIVQSALAWGKMLRPFSLVFGFICRRGRSGAGPPAPRAAA